MVLDDFFRRQFVKVTLLLLACISSPDVSIAATQKSILQSFVTKHCSACHDSDAKEAGLDLVGLAGANPSSEGLSAWKQVREAILQQRMPPKGEERPEENEIAQFQAAILGHASQLPADRYASLRRLNRREYENTVRDLLGIDASLVDLLPEDGSVQGFDNVADGLSISSVLMEQYLEAANHAFDSAIRRIEPLPVETRHVRLLDVKDNQESVKKKKGGVIEVDGALVKFTPGWPPARVDPVHPIEDGVYRCRVAVWPIDPSDRTLAVAVYVGSLFGTESRRFIGIFDVTGSAEQPRIIEFTSPIEEGHSIHVLPRIWPEHITYRDKHEPRPGVAIAWAETTGPLDQDFPSLAQQRLFGDVDSISLVPAEAVWMRHRKGVKRHVVHSSQPRQDAERILHDLIPRAFRRPVSDEEMQPFVQLTLDRLEAGRTFEQAVRSGVTAVLCAPQFLLLNQPPVAADAQQICQQYNLASRMSYFLWSTMPDERLLKLAAANRLTDSKVRNAEVDRMLQDPRSQHFVENFTGQWLRLREIEDTTPDTKLYPEFDPLLQEAMVQETTRFFRHVLDENLSVSQFVDSDFTFLNERLARHYGLSLKDYPALRGHENYDKVALPKASVRGGVLTQASLLKVTANGTTTSPVTRGLWVLDGLLGQVMPPPPPGIPAVEPDIRGATTIREQMRLHSGNQSCAKCHQWIDPPGFALEEFDAIGGHRDFYRSIGEGEKISGPKLSYLKGPPVISSVSLPSGQTVDGFQDFRAMLASNPQRIANSLAAKLFVYGTGRPVTLADQGTIEALVTQAKAEQYGLKSLVKSVVNSPGFVDP